MSLFSFGISEKNIQLKLLWKWTKNKEPSCFSLISVPPSVRSTITFWLGGYVRATAIFGKALDWVISYLKERTQRVVITDQSSSTTILKTGPLFFSLYIQPIGAIILAHGLFFHQYADDLQVYAHFILNHSALVAAVKQIKDCLDGVKVWTARNYMFMNDGKTQYLPIVPSLQMQSWIKVWFTLVWLQLRLRFVFSVLVFAVIGTLTRRSMCPKLKVLALSICVLDLSDSRRHQFINYSLGGALWSLTFLCAASASNDNCRRAV